MRISIRGKVLLGIAAIDWRSCLQCRARCECEQDHLHGRSTQHPDDLAGSYRHGGYPAARVDANGA